MTQEEKQLAAAGRHAGRAPCPVFLVLLIFPDDNGLLGTWGANPDPPFGSIGHIGLRVLGYAVLYLHRD